MRRSLSLSVTVVVLLFGFFLAPHAYGAAGNPHAGNNAGAIPSLLPAHAPLDVSLAPSQAQPGEPIAYIGHGGFFDRTGRQIVPTADWVARVQSWYRGRLLAGLKPSQKAEFSAFEGRLNKGLNVGGQAGLVMQQRSLDWLIASSPRTTAVGRMQAKLNALKYRLSWRLALSDDLKQLEELQPFKLDAKIAARLRLPEFAPVDTKTATTNSGAAYTAECMAAGVPIPPSIGNLGVGGWTSQGFIPIADQFITGTPAELRTFENAQGMCIALPRYTSSTLATVKLDGVICLSKTTSKVCFWDNQMSGAGFWFPTGTQIPIGAPDLLVNAAGQYQAGGAEIEFGSGGVCTDCHAGENPYIIHPNSNLGTVTMGGLNSSLALPTFGPNRYDPLVGASWPQNSLSQAVDVPLTCIGCHVSGSAGRFPHLSTEYNGLLEGYCKTILTQALTRTMPLGSPGTEATSAAVITLKSWCGIAATSGPSNRGDPHLTTTNGINYDFQSAGEFTSLRNSDTGFELQTRQTPVLTSFTPGANAWTGLASCVSLNTAAALRVGGHRISYQPSDQITDSRMLLRIDGKPVTLPSGGLNLGGGNRIATAAAGGGIDVRTADGTRVNITPNYWSSEGYWYLNVEVLNTPAREGTMGTILGSDWLPQSPSGSSYGSAPGGLAARHALLNGTFADAWRVTNTTSLFDYASGTSTASFTERTWPPPPGSTCTTIRSNPWPGGLPRRPVSPMDPKQAQSLCREFSDPAVFDACVFDVTATGNASMVDAYRLTLQVRALP